MGLTQWEWGQSGGHVALCKSKLMFGTNLCSHAEMRTRPGFPTRSRISSLCMQTLLFFDISDESKSL